MCSQDATSMKASELQAQASFFSMANSLSVAVMAILVKPSLAVMLDIFGIIPISDSSGSISVSGGGGGSCNNCHHRHHCYHHLRQRFRSVVPTLLS